MCGTDVNRAKSVRAYNSKSNERHSGSDNHEEEAGRLSRHYGRFEVKGSLRAGAKKGPRLWKARCGASIYLEFHLHHKYLFVEDYLRQSKFLPKRFRCPRFQRARNFNLSCIQTATGAILKRRAQKRADSFVATFS